MVNLSAAATWAPILVLVALTASGLVARAGGLLTYAYPLAVLAAGAYLYRR